MKSLMKLYESCRNALRITFFAFALIAFGTIIQSENVNVFYTFSNSVLLVIANGSLMLGKTIVLNLPLIFMVNIVCKKANSGFPVILALIGYFTFMITMSLFASQSLPNYFYSHLFSGLLNVQTKALPFETGLIGALLVGEITKFSFVFSRQKGNRAILSFLNNDSAAIIYEIILCSFLGLIIAYLFPFGYKLLQKLVGYVSANLADSRRLALYGIAERILSVLGLGEFVRYPFWFTSAGGTYTSIITGEIFNGDVGIWKAIRDVSNTYNGAGRFITPYYVINFFLVPAVYLGMYFSMSDGREKAHHLIPLIGLILLSVACGNPLPLEITLLFTAPLLLVLYIAVVGLLFWYLAGAGIFLGFSCDVSDIVTAMPGSFPDYIINLRNIHLSSSVSGIFVVGIVAAVVMFLITLAYYNFLAYDIARTGKIEKTTKDIISALGGIDNVKTASNGVLKLSVDLYDLEITSKTKIQKLNISKVVETKKGVSMNFGVSSCIIAKAIRNQVKAKSKIK